MNTAVKKYTVRTQSLVFKDSTGKWRWLSISSNSFMDRLGEVISQEALERDVLRADLTKEYGPLLWWHQRDLVLGWCDFNMMVGKFLVESGTFVDDIIPAILAPLWWSLGVSIGFYHAEDEPIVGPDWVPVYYNILRDERSVLPWEWAANSYTAFATGREIDMAQRNEALESLTSLVGPQLVGDILNQANQMELDLTAQGVITKSTPDASLPVLIQLARLTQKADGDSSEDEGGSDDSDGEDTDTDAAATEALSERLATAYSETLATLQEVGSQLGAAIQQMAVIAGVQAQVEAEGVANKAFREKTEKDIGDLKLLLAGLVTTKTKSAGGNPTAQGFRASQAASTATPDAEDMSHTGKTVLTTMEELADAL